MVEQQQSSPDEVATPEAAQPPQEPEGSGEVTPEAIEAYWRKRQAGSDRAHSEETRVLREQLATAQAAASAKAASGAGGNDVVAELRRQNEDLQRQVRESEAQRLVDTRRAMYPYAAEALADNNLVAGMDEARLAALNAKLSAEAPANGGRRIDANNPARTASAPPKRLNEMTTDELKAVMEQESQAWLDEVRGGY